MSSDLFGKSVKVLIGSGLVIALASCTPEETSAEIANNPVPLENVIEQPPIKRCINLGNGLDAPVEGSWGYTIEDDHIREIARAGFDTIRFPIRWNTRALESSPYTINPEFFDRVDHITRLALDEGLTVILDFHHYMELMHDPRGQERRFYGLWEQIARHYSGWSDKVIFEIINEPEQKLDKPELQRMLPRVLDIIRSSNPDRWVMFTGDHYGSYQGLMRMDLPKDDRSIWTYHYYSPHEFTHQKAHWTNGLYQEEVSWTGTASEVEPILKDHARIANYAAENGRPLFLGEFGALNTGGAYEERLAWIETVRRAAEDNGTSWCVWDFAADFAFYDLDSKSWDAGLLNAVMSDYAPNK